MLRLLVVFLFGLIPAAHAAVTTPFNITVSIGALTPGPSLALFNAPYYVCNTNFFVATNGNDGNNGTSAGTPWKTLQKATNANTGPGSCVNVAAGTYNGVQMINGGNTATRTGWVAFRCATMDACHIANNAGVNGAAAVYAGYCSSQSSPDGVPYTCPANTTLPDYFLFDGFAIDQGGTGGGQVGFNCLGQPFNPGASEGPHHCGLFNSIIDGPGQSGIATTSGDYLYFIHNTIKNTSGTTCGGAQGSGISLNSHFAPAGYTPTTDDQSGMAPFFGFPTWVIGGSGLNSFFHVVVAFNVIFNSQSQCGAESDHNGIIFDQIANGGGLFPSYTFPELAYGNVVYNNAGNGIEVFISNNVYVANNSTFNNGLNPNWGSPQIIDLIGGTSAIHNFFYNNVSVGCTTAVPSTAPSKGGNATFYLSPTSGNDPASNNVSLFVTASSLCKSTGHNSFVPADGQWVFESGQADPTSTNKLSTNPLWANVSFGTPGTQTTPPANTNFALQAGSPAINYGVIQGSWMPATSVDAGACPRALTTCP